MRPWQILPVTLVVAITIAGFFGARALSEADADDDAAHRADVAATEIRARLAQGSTLTESLRRFLARGGAGRTSAGFADNSAELLSPAGFPAAAWVEQVPSALRGAYERRIGRPIATQDQRGAITREGPRPAYLPATLVSGVTPMVTAGIDLGGSPGMRAAVRRASRLYDAGATPLTRRRDGTRGLFLVRFAPRLDRGVVRPGFAVVFVSELALRSAATAAPGLMLTSGTGARPAGVGRTFSQAGERFDVVVPREPLRGAGAVLPWIILAAGLVLAALAGALGRLGARRTRAQAELDRIFTLSSDLIAVADFAGHFKRVNPAVAHVLGYTPEEFLAKPYVELVHPEDRGRTTEEADAIAGGRTTISFENRYVHKDGSLRTLEWTATPVVKDGLMYGVARDVTERRRLDDEQAALRRVATLVARGVEPDELFSAVSREVGLVFGSDMASVGRFDPRGPAFVVVGMAKTVPGVAVGSRWPLEDQLSVTAVHRTGRSARVDRPDWSQDDAPIAEVARRLGARSAVASPIVVEGRLWGAINVSARERLPPDAGERLEKFTDLLATAVANAEARAALRRLADEQSALRRVATLVAEGGSPSAVFDAVAAETAALLGAEAVSVVRHDSPDESTVLARHGAATGTQPSAPRLAVDIVVEGRRWGAIVASWPSDAPPPPDTEPRLAAFAELLDAAIANADSRDQLTASRARLLSEADDARRRLVRDLHDGAQQRLVHTIATLKLALQAMPAQDGDGRSLVGEALDHAQRSNAELRELAHGILPGALTLGGLSAGVGTVVARIDLPVRVQIPGDRFPPEIEASAYFVVAEALTNIVKHSRARSAEVTVTARDGVLAVEVRDDGVGGADLDGHGLVGMRDRVNALGGRLTVESPPGRGTVLAAALPLGGVASELVPPRG